MKITNEMGLPSAFVEMAQSDYVYEPNEYRVTSLLKGVREAILERRHFEDIEQDVSDMIWLLFGTAVHHILERQEEGEHEFKEERIKVEIGNYLLSGQFDEYNYKEKKITDYKTCSVWKIIYGDFTDWKRQLHIYAWMLKSIGFEVDKCEVIALMKDHSKAKAKFDRDYPQLPVKKITFKFTDKDYRNMDIWLKAKFEIIERCEKLPDDELPLCTLEERFNKGNKYAVMAKGKKRALRVLDTKVDATDWMRANGKGDLIEVREGEDVKCKDYCSVNKFCSYYQSKYGV